jgi:hypothetical protein
VIVDEGLSEILTPVVLLGSARGMPDIPYLKSKLFVEGSPYCERCGCQVVDSPVRKNNLHDQVVLRRPNFRVLISLFKNLIA